MSDETLERCNRKFYARMNPAVPILVCASCCNFDVPVVAIPATDTMPGLKAESVPGIMEFYVYDDIDGSCGAGGALECLTYSDEELAKYNLPVPAHVAVHGGDTTDNRALYEYYKHAISLTEVPIDGKEKPLLVHLDSCYVTNATDAAGALLLRDDGRPQRRAHLCSTCHASVRRGKRPAISIASGYDLGHPERAGLPELSLAEVFCIQRNRALQSTLLIRFARPTGGSAATYATLTGFSIVYATTSAVVCANTLPDRNFAHGLVHVAVEGPRGAVNSTKLEGMLRRLGQLRVYAPNVLQGRRACGLHHPPVPRPSTNLVARFQRPPSPGLQRHRGRLSGACNCLE